MPLAAWGAGAGGALAAAAARAAAAAASAAAARPLLAGGGGAPFRRPSLRRSLLLLRAHSTRAGEAAAAADGGSLSADPVITRVRKHVKVRLLFALRVAVSRPPAATKKDTNTQITNQNAHPQNEQDFAKKLPWEADMPPERAASVLGAFFGVPSLRPGDAAALAPRLDRASLSTLLRATTPWPLGDAPTSDPEAAVQRLGHARVGRPALGTEAADLEAALFSFADHLTEQAFGDAVHLRGIVEFSNVCANDCGYCGVRKHAPRDADTGLPLRRYTMPLAEIAEVARWAHGHGIATLMLQGGELGGEKRLAYLESAVRTIRADTARMDAEARGVSDAEFEAMGEEGKQRLGVRVALSVGELAPGEYARLYAAGARRYLLRVETSSPALYALLHPPDMRWGRRVASLASARAAGFQLGTGSMVGLPGQTLGDLAGDVLFFRDVAGGGAGAGAGGGGANMVGVGPYVPAAGTPVADLWEGVYGLGGLAYRVGADEVARRAVGGGAGWCGAGEEAEDTAGAAQRAAARRGRRADGEQRGLDEASEAPHPPPPTSFSSEKDAAAHSAARQDHKARHMRAMFELTTRVNALARLALPGANITATTALQAIDPNGREVALRRGANVLMPILTPTRYRRLYQLYEGKPCVTDTADECRRCLAARVEMIGRRLRLGEHGDPPNFGEQEQERARAAAASGAGAGAGLSRSFSTSSSSSGVSLSPPTWSSARPSSGCDGGGIFGGGGSSSPSSSRPFGTGAAAAAAARPRPPPLGSVCGSCGAASSAPPLSSAVPPPGPSAGSDVRRLNVGVFGAMNAGKSTLVNAVTRQDAAIVDATPGTTADVRATLLELHGAGPARLLDTAGLDEQGALGEKKRAKALAALKECDVAVVVVDVARLAGVTTATTEVLGTVAAAGGRGGGGGGVDHAASAATAASAAAAHTALRDALRWEALVLDRARKAGAVPLLLLNLRGAGAAASPSAPDLSHPLYRAAAAVRGCLDPCGQALALAVDLHGTTGASGSRVARDVADAVCAAITEAAARSAARPGVKALPEWVLAAAATEEENKKAAAAATKRESERAAEAAAATAAASRTAGPAFSSSFSSSSAPPPPPSPLLLQPALKPGYVFLVIPMDAETPSARLLRPQALVQEEAVRHWALTTAFRLDLGAARGAKGEAARSAERARFLRALRPALEHDGPKLLVTDSQAIDVVHPWTLEHVPEEEEEEGKQLGALEHVPEEEEEEGKQLGALAAGGGRSGVPAAALGSGENGGPSTPSSPRPLLPITTFSIAMINRASGGRLPLFVEGLRAFAALEPGDRVLVAEACNHSRITAACADIGLVQIPQRLRERAGGEVEIEHAFGREFPDLVGGGGEGAEATAGGDDKAGRRFALAVHCGGCMIDAQKMRARLSDAEEAGLPMTNYGLLLAFAAAPRALERCLAPWGVSAVVSSFMA